MESKRQVEKKYNSLLKKVEIDDFYKIDLNNRINCYVCTKCDHITKTKDIDAGVTPFKFTCEKCHGTATSSFFNDIAPNQLPTFEWYRPTLKQVLKMRKTPGMIDHILGGGLNYRKIN